MAFDPDGAANPWYYELAEPGFNLRVPDINCALGLSQLGKLARFVEARSASGRGLRRNAGAAGQSRAPARARGALDTAWHIYVVRIDFAAARHFTRRG